jgi:hypothetical protein
MSANQLVDDARFGIGGNQPPLDEYLPELLAPFRTRQAQMIEVAKSARIIDRESAEKVVDLDVLIKGLAAELETQREQLKRPYLDACKLIDGQFGALTQPLGVARNSARLMLTSWNRAEEERAEAVRQRLEAERRQAEAEAEAARRVAEEKRTAGSNSVAAELEAMQAEEQARRLADRAATVAAEPLRSHLGAVGTRREIDFQVINLRTLLSWMLKTPGIAGQLQAAASTIMSRYLRGLGVAAIEQGVDVPGLEVRIQKQAQVR